MKRSPPVKEFVTKDGRWCVLRPPTARDLDGLTRFANAFVREKRNNPDLGLVSFDRRLTRRQEGRWLGEVVKGVARKEVVSIAAFVGGRVVGHCAINRRKFRDDRHAGVFGIAILDGFRGVGIGEKMMDAALEEARRIGIQLVELDVFSTNAAAIRLYEKMGFEKAGTIPDKIFRRGRYYDEDVMFLDLRKR